MDKVEEVSPDMKSLPKLENLADVEILIDVKPSRHSGKSYRREQERIKEKKMRDIIDNHKGRHGGFYVGYYPVIRPGYSYDAICDKSHIKDHPGSSYQRYLKRSSNKAIRKYKGEIPKGRYCYKIFDYWWELC